MTESPEELAAVEQLLAESDSLHAWLARLDQAPAGASDTVRQRVRNDYQHRLDQVTAGLRAHADVIAAKLHDDRAEHAELQSRATASREALAEAELRHAVGEFDADRFEAERRRHGSDLETFQFSVVAVAERIARLEEIQGVVQRAPRTLAIDPEPIETAIVPEVHLFTVDAPEFVAITDLAPDTDDALTIFDDDTIESDAHGATDDSPAAVLDTGPLSFRPSGLPVEPPRTAAALPTRPRPFESAPPLGIPSADVPPRFVRPGERLGGQPAPPVTAPAPEPTAVRGDVVATGPAPEVNSVPVGRTLRCGECGAMNRPLEWYCEKCGAELTAV